MIDDRNYAEEEVAEDLLDLIREYEAEIKKLKERESALLSSLQASLGDSATALIKEYVAVRTDRSLRLSSSICGRAMQMKRQRRQSSRPDIQGI